MTCHCDHLTNFGIMMDWTDQVKANDPGTQRENNIGATKIL